MKKPIVLFLTIFLICLATLVFSADKESNEEESKCLANRRSDLEGEEDDGEGKIIGVIDQEDNIEEENMYPGRGKPRPKPNSSKPTPQEPEG